MLRRRDFVQCMAVTSGLVALGRSSLPAAAARAMAAVRLHTVICDRRFDASRAFGAAAERLGFSTHAMDGDITALWADHLAERWRNAPAAIAGLTAHGPLFCLERFGWDHHLRVVFRAEHRGRCDGTIEHRFWGPTKMLSWVARHVAALGSGYGSCMAGMVGACPPAQGTTELALTLVAPGDGGDATEVEPLYSWVIAPRAQS